MTRSHYQTFSTIEALHLLADDIDHVAMCIKRGIYVPEDEQCSNIAIQLLDTADKLHLFASAKERTPDATHKVSRPCGTDY